MQENTFACTNMNKWAIDPLDLTRTVNKELHANAKTSHSTLKCLYLRINVDKQPRNFKNTLNRQVLTAVYNTEHIGFKEKGVLKVVRQRADIQILDALTRLE